jgi:sialic acid synthase
MRSLTIGNTRIGDDQPCYVIAEIGHNHGGNVATACDMIRVAKACGACAVKLQKRANETLYSRAILDQPYENEHSFGKTYGEHRAVLEFSHAQYLQCQQAAAGAQVDFFATAFDEPSVDFLMTLGVPAIKIASGGLTDLPLLDYAARARVPIILSTGGGSFREIEIAVNTIARVPHSDFAILHCTAAYPVRDFAELNLACIRTLRDLYPDVVIGWSGHDSGIAMSVMAYTLGARIIEKHFTINRANKGTDHAFSLEPSGLSKLCRDLARSREAMGDGRKRYLPSEVGPIAKMRRRSTPDGPRITGEKDVPTLDRTISAA